MERSGNVGLPKLAAISMGEGAEAAEEDVVFGGMESVVFESGCASHVSPRF